MTYELAKELKEAGFPQGSQFYFTESQRSEPLWVGTKAGMKNEEWAAVPTLEELIAACGDRFKSLWRHSSGTWTACYGTRRIAPRRKRDGATPEEAVAKLWLALHPKSND